MAEHLIFRTPKGEPFLTAEGVFRAMLLIAISDPKFFDSKSVKMENGKYAIKYTCLKDDTYIEVLNGLGIYLDKGTTIYNKN